MRSGFGGFLLIFRLLGLLAVDCYAYVCLRGRLILCQRTRVGFWCRFLSLRRGAPADQSRGSQQVVLLSLDLLFSYFLLSLRYLALVRRVAV